MYLMVKRIQSNSRGRNALRQKASTRPADSKAGRSPPADSKAGPADGKVSADTGKPAETKGATSDGKAAPTPTAIDAEPGKTAESGG